jgi:putative ATPase
MGRPDLYRPAPRGFEREIAKRLAYWAKLREEGA